MLRRLVRKPVTWIIVTVFAVGGAFGLYWFQPWRLVTNSTVNDMLPMVDATPPPGTSTSAPSTVQLATGTLISHEHDTSGTVRLVRLADGKVQLLLENLNTSDGPDLHVWLTDQKVEASEWYSFDDGRYVELGKLKANHGNHVYTVPAGTDLNGLRSVTIWCKRFHISFGAAELT